ncbi:uncharacterized protein LOC132803712 isoform X2 [Ziziphus jujuba]|uniref:Uncharacterized protein LOC132803712 isoform X2 n=1 Tax=Ziziphus jujuba TaxID=326968 RepID=A0ABM4A8L9_ZIZJJ|nr:uncharacterized protein LOC132803712 isoform X2 [Ziziphus jujuba]
MYPIYPIMLTCFDPCLVALSMNFYKFQVREAKKETGQRGGRGVGHSCGRRKPRKTSKVAQVTTNVNLAEKNLGDDEPNGVDKPSGKKIEVCQLDEMAQVTIDVNLAEKNLVNDKADSADKPERKESYEVVKVNFGDDKFEEKEDEMPELEDVDKDDDEPGGDKGVGDDTNEDKEMTNGMLFEFLCTLFRIPFSLARYFYARLEGVFTSPASVLKETSTTRLDINLLRAMLQDLSLVISDPPPVVDSDALRDDKLHDQANRMAELDDIYLALEELIILEEYLNKKKDRLANLVKRCTTVDGFKNLNKLLSEAEQKVKDMREEMDTALRRLQKCLLFEDYYHKQNSAS